MLSNSGLQCGGNCGDPLCPDEDDIDSLECPVAGGEVAAISSHFSKAAAAAGGARASPKLKRPLQYVDDPKEHLPSKKRKLQEFLGGVLGVDPDEDLVREFEDFIENEYTMGMKSAENSLGPGDNTAPKSPLVKEPEKKARAAPSKAKGVEYRKSTVLDCESGATVDFTLAEKNAKEEEA